MMNAATKKFVCIFLFTALLLGILPNQTVAAFTDITDTQTQTAAAVLAGMDITTGTTSTSFSPNTQLTRAQFCAFVIRMTGQENLVATAARKNLFSDVPSGSWSSGREWNICWAWWAGSSKEKPPPLKTRDIPGPESSWKTTGYPAGRWR